MSRPMPKMQCTSGLLSSILTSDSPALPGNVDIVVIESEIVDNAGVPFRISPIYRPIPKCHLRITVRQSTSGLLFVY